MFTMKSTVILIPAYRAEMSLVTLIKSLREACKESPIVVVRDGMQGDQKVYDSIVGIEMVEVIEHLINLGKGRALKTGFNYIGLKYPNSIGVVTVDADGQHLPMDVARVSSKLFEDNAMILGSRFQVKERIPFRSQLGNRLTRLVFKFFLGLSLQDTQTGLRAVPNKCIPELISLGGERYEYETNMLIHAKQHGWRIAEVPIQTVYVDQNRGSHFNPVLDSMRIYFLIFRFLFSSLTSAVIDQLFFGIFTFLGFAINTSFIGSRLISGAYNYYVNRNITFKAKSGVFSSLCKYWLLVVLLGSISYFGTIRLVRFGMNVFLAKVTMDLVLFLISFEIQKSFVFDGADANHF